VKTLADALGVARSNLVVQAAGDSPRQRRGHRPRPGQIRLKSSSETAELHHRGRGCSGELPVMIEMDIFKEKHRFSEKTPHPGPRSVVGAATSGVSLQASVGPGRHSAAQGSV